MTRPTAPDGSPLPRKHVAWFLDTLRWAGVMLEDRGGRLQAEVTPREGGDSGMVEGDGGGRP